MYHLSAHFFCFKMNLKSFLKSRDMGINYYQKLGVFQFRNKGEKICFSQQIRSFRYEPGIQTRLERLASLYQLTEIDFSEGDVFIDCGANIGELGMWASKYKVQYYAFEPEEREAICCNLNNPHAAIKTEPRALWYEAAELKFYSKADTADSSLIEIGDFDNIKVVKTVTLSEFVKEHNIKKIKLLKVEAEGAEPEVLQGAESVLPIIEYVTVDCGSERGIEQLPTYNECSEILLKNGFKLIGTHDVKATFLFKNQNL